MVRVLIRFDRSNIPRDELTAATSTDCLYWGDADTGWRRRGAWRRMLKRATDALETLHCLLVLEMALPPHLTLLCADSLDTSLLTNKTTVKTNTISHTSPHMTRGATRSETTTTPAETVALPVDHKGISYHQSSGKWEVRVGSSRTYIGRFDSQEIAVQERDRALKLLLDPMEDAGKASHDDQLFNSSIRPHLSFELARRVGCVLQTHKTLDSVAARLHWLEQLLQKHISACPFVQNLTSIV